MSAGAWMMAVVVVVTLVTLAVLLEERLGTLPASSPRTDGEDWKLAETPLEADDERGG